MTAVATVKKSLGYWVLDHFVKCGDKNNIPRSFFILSSFVQIALQLFVLYNSCFLYANSAHRKVMRPCSFSLLLSPQLSTFLCIRVEVVCTPLARPVVLPHLCCSSFDIYTWVQTAIIFIPSGSVISLLDEKLIFQRVRNLRQKRLIWSSARALPANLLLFLIQPSCKKSRWEDPSPVPGEAVPAPKPKLSAVELFPVRIPSSSWI